MLTIFHVWRRALKQETAAGAGDTGWALKAGPERLCTSEMSFLGGSEDTLKTGMLSPEGWEELRCLQYLMPLMHRCTLLRSVALVILLSSQILSSAFTMRKAVISKTPGDKSAQLFRSALCTLHDFCKPGIWHLPLVWNLFRPAFTYQKVSFQSLWLQGKPEHRLMHWYLLPEKWLSKLLCSP